MFFLGAFVISGGVYLLVNRMGGLLIFGICGAIVLNYVTVGLLWFNGVLGLNALMVNSWQSLSGVTGPDQIWQEGCSFGEPGYTSPTLTGLLVIILGIVLSIANVIPGLIAFVGLPAGVVVTAAGAVTGLFSRGKNVKVLVTGLLLFTAGLAGVLIAGLVMRLIHSMTGYLVC